MGDRRSPGYESDPSIGLDEVERALSLLDGRHPDYQKTRRELLSAAVERRRAAERAVQRRRRRRRLLSVIAVFNLFAVGFAGWVTSEVRRRDAAMRDALLPLAEPFVAAGFSPVAMSDVIHEHAVSGPADPGSCFVALAPAGIGLRVTHGQATAAGIDSVGFCTCAAETFTATAEDSVEALPNPSGAKPAPVAKAGRWVLVLRADARTLGGALAVSYWAARPKGAVLGGGECAEEAFDAWLAGAKPAGIEGLPDGLVASAKRRGFTVVAAATPPKFAIVDTAPGSCLIASRGELPIDLRRAGGERLSSGGGGPVVACTDRAERWTVFGTGSGVSPLPIVVVSSPADRAGGLLGATEFVSGRGGARWLSPTGRESDARALLLASGAANISVGAGSASTRLVAFSLADATNILPPSGDDSFHYCAPPLEGHPKQALCVQSAREEWKLAGDGALAFAPTPVWLTLFAERPDPEIVRAELRALAFARAMSRLGYEPTLHDGLEVVAREPGAGKATTVTALSGREGDDGVAVIGIARRKPWLFAYAPEGGRAVDKPAPSNSLFEAAPFHRSKGGGAAFDLGFTIDGLTEEIVPLKAGERVRFFAKLEEEIPKDERRIVVFRKRGGR